jgi:hypothetical protein
MSYDYDWGVPPNFSKPWFIHPGLTLNNKHGGFLWDLEVNYV